MPPERLFEEAVRVSGLAPIFAKVVFQRAAKRIGLRDVEALSRVELERLIPILRPKIELFLGATEASKRCLVLTQLSHAAVDLGAYRLDDPALDD